MAKKVLVAMSGGVDSSVTAWLLTQQGYTCIGVTMKLYENETIGRCRSNTCCSLDDIEDARSVAFHIGIPYHVFNFTADFKQQVIERFARCYESGGTPNPCIDCNRYLKFDRLYQRARELGCDYVATGHYARISTNTATGRLGLQCGVDASKDQSYVLYSLTQEQLAHTLLPLGGLEKSKVRQIAESEGFLNAHKHDSQDICFVPDGDYAAFLERYRGAAYPAGDFVDAAGTVLGRHKGFVRYTLGQRKGLGIAAAHPYYVIGKDPVQNTVTLGEEQQLFSSDFAAVDVNWLGLGRPTESFRAEVCTRYHAKRHAALITPTKTGFAVHAETPIRAVTPGQAVVVYSGSDVICGGAIHTAIPMLPAPTA